MSDATARIIQKAIPDSLRLNEHPDAKLVCDAIATVLVAIRESDSITLNGQATDINAALSKYDESVFKPHITQEDEDWNAVKAKAALAPSPYELAMKRIASVNSWDELDAFEGEFKELYRSLPGKEKDDWRRAMRKAVNRIESNPKYESSEIPENQARNIIEKAGKDFDSVRTEGGRVEIGNDAEIKFRTIPLADGSLQWIYTYVSPA